MNLEDFRRNYQLGRLSRSELLEEPIKQFEVWLQEMLQTDLTDPTAMILASVGEGDMPQQRCVLLKKVSVAGFVFFTDMASRKGRDIEHNAKVSLLFPWQAYERQVRVCGTASMLDRNEVEAYFHSRPLASQIAAFTSKQSQVIGSRQQLEREYQSNVERFTDKAPLPERWGGYLVKPISLEFWQGGEHRLHDRLEYRRTGNKWQIERLQP